MRIGARAIATSINEPKDEKSLDGRRVFINLSKIVDSAGRVTL